ncbi:MAG: Wzz/FepE/Etk N-terminal domain-containing protein [Candidatus Marinimicrobia bacterium]|nr:Wzz/FepE/Etk N-terminal domain-containing protein [Candidatus Neomarinimicrobiota bacterium]
MSQDLTLRDYFKIFWKNKWLIGIFTFMVSVLAIIISLVLPQWYAGTAQVIRPQSQVLDMSSIQMQTMDIFGIADAPTNRYLSILNSRLLKEQICKKYDLMKAYDLKWMDKTIQRFEENYYNVEMGDENQIVIVVYDRDQERVAEMTNYVVFLLDSINTDLSTQYGKQEKIFIESQLNNILDSLALLENDLVDYMDEKNVISVNDQLRTELEFATDLKYQILIKETELKIMKQTNQSKLLIDAQELEIDELTKHYNKLFNPTTELFINLSDAPDVSLFIRNIERQITYYNEVLLFIGPLYEQAKITEAKYVPTFEVLDYAQRPDRKAKPKRVFIVVAAFMFALLTSGVYILLKETQD